MVVIKAATAKGVTVPVRRRTPGTTGYTGPQSAT